MQASAAPCGLPPRSRLRPLVPPRSRPTSPSRITPTFRACPLTRLPRPSRSDCSKLHRCTAAPPAGAKRRGLLLSAEPVKSITAKSTGAHAMCRGGSPPSCAHGLLGAHAEPRLPNAVT